jgi:uncharacterized protein (DUF2336 family)
MSEGDRIEPGSRRPRGPEYERAKAAAAAADVHERRRLAADTTAPPEILYFLAEDEDAEVRAAVARNPVTPRQADKFLARDDAVDVRSRLCEKIAALAPDLGGESRSAVRKATVDVLETLARDQASRVRVMLSEAIKDLPDTDPEVVSRVVERLARDDDLEVSEPVLEHSPLLTDDLLIDIIKSPPVQGAVAAITRRKRVSARVADAVVDTEDEGAIVTLLRNDQAQIREATLDRLIEVAPEKPAYHEPLVRRPTLSTRHALALAKFVAVALVAELQAREEIDDKTGAILSEEMARRLEEDPSAARFLADQPPVGERNRAVQMHNTGALTDKVIGDALAAGRRVFVLASLALRTKLDEPVVHSLIGSRNPRAITALAWKAGLNMAFAHQLQIRLGYIEAAAALRPDADGNYPLHADDMQWQIDLASDDAADG